MMGLIKAIEYDWGEIFPWRDLSSHFLNWLSLKSICQVQLSHNARWWEWERINTIFWHDDLEQSGILWRCTLSIRVLFLPLIYYSFTKMCTAAIKAGSKREQKCKKTEAVEDFALRSNLESHRNFTPIPSTWRADPLSFSMNFTKESS